MIESSNPREVTHLYTRPHAPLPPWPFSSKTTLTPEGGARCLDIECFTRALLTLLSIATCKGHTHDLTAVLIACAG